MAKAVIVTLADEVTADLNKKAGGWSQSFKAERKYQPTANFEEVDVLHVQVAPMTWNKQPDSRSEWSHEYTIDVGIQYRAGPNAEITARFDELIKLVEEISDHYENTRPTLADCVLVAVSFGGPTGAPYHHDSAHSNHTFVSVISLTFRKWR